jgi:hypothetical protein
MILSTVAFVLASQTNLALNLKMRPVPEVIAKIQPQVGAKLLVSDAFRDRKLSVFCDSSSPDEILSSIATALDGKWLKKDKIWTLAVDSKAYDLADRYYRAKADVARQELTKNLSSMLAAARKMPRAEPKRGASTTQFGPIGDGGGGEPGQSNSSSISVNRGVSRAESLKNYLSSWQFLAGLPGSSVDRLLRNDILIASDQHLNPAHRIDESFLGSSNMDPKPERIICFLWVADDQTAIEVRAFARGEGSTISNRFQLPIAGEQPGAGEDNRLLGQPFVEELKSWQAETSANVAWNTKMDDAEVTAPPYAGGAISLSDQMEWFHRSTGIPVVVEAFRAPSMMGRPKKAASAGDWIAQHVKNGRLLYKFVDHTMVARQPEYWSFRQNEIPESIWESSEATAKARQLFLGDYAVFLSKLTDAQLSGMATREHLSLMKWPEVGAETVAVLRFFGSLSRAQQEDVFSSSISPGSLTPDQLHLANLALRAGIVGNGRVEGQWIKNFDGTTVWPTEPMRIGCTTQTTAAHFIRMNQIGKEPPKREEGFEPLAEFRFTIDDDNYLLIPLSMAVDEAHLKKVDELRERTEKSKSSGS